MTTALHDAPPMTDDGERLLTRTQAAELLGVSVRTIDRLAAEGALTRRGRGRLVRYRLVDVRASLDRRPTDQEN